MEEDDRSCRSDCREEFRCARLGLGYKYPVHFVTAQCGSMLLYPIWTSFVLVYHVAFIIAMIIMDSENDSFPDKEWFIYLSHWAYLILNIAFFWDFAVTIYLHVTKSNVLDGSEYKMPWYLIVDWLLFNIKNAIGVVVTGIYYGLLDFQLKAASTEVHTMNMVFILLDFFVSAKPVRFLHFYQPFLAIMVYFLFSLAYQRTGNGTVYSVLDWGKSSTLGYILGLGIIGIPLIHIGFFGLYNLRLLLHRCLCNKRMVPITDMKMNERRKY